MSPILGRQKEEGKHGGGKKGGRRCGREENLGRKEGKASAYGRKPPSNHQIAEKRSSGGRGCKGDLI